MKLIGTITYIDEKNALFISEKSKKYKIKLERLNGALLDDKVQLSIKKRKTTVTKILKRSNTTYVGLFDRTKYGNFVLTKGQQCYTDFIINSRHVNNARKGDIVEIEFYKWEENQKLPYGKVINILSRSNESERQIFKHFLPYKFSQNILNEVEDIRVKNEQLESRVNLTHLKCYTIDPKNSRDFDDAISLEQTNDIIRLGVHISDVREYIKENSLIDLEALRRSFTLYFPNSLVPMLPHRLSNGICSLKENELKLTISVLFDIDKDYNIIDYKIVKSIINVTHNLTYNQANNIINDKNHDDYEYFNTLKDVVFNIIKNKRLKILEPKLKLELDDDNKYVPILKEKRDAERIIEELMILTNTYIATYLAEYYNHNLLRIHNSPNDKSLKRLQIELDKIGYKLKNENTFDEIYNLLLEKDVKYKYLISYYLLSIQQKAYYSLTDNGHFALNREYYTHFTSPIRRYSDILVHRMLKAVLTNSKLPKIQNKIIKHINNKELLIRKIENKLFYYQTFNYLENNSITVNGQVISIKKNEYKIRSEYLINGILKFKNTKHKYNIGDFVKLNVINVNKTKKQIFFSENE